MCTYIAIRLATSRFPHKEDMWFQLSFVVVFLTCKSVLQSIILQFCLHNASVPAFLRSLLLQGEVWSIEKGGQKIRKIWDAALCSLCCRFHYLKNKRQEKLRLLLQLGAAILFQKVARWSSDSESKVGFFKMRLKSVRDLEFFWLSAHWLQSWTKFPALPSPPRKGSRLLSYRELCKVDAGDSSWRHQAVKVGEVYWTLCLYRNRSMFLGQLCTSMSFLRLGVWN